MIKPFPIFLLNLLYLTSISLSAQKEATVKLMVTDEAGAPVVDAAIRIVFHGIQREKTTDVYLNTNDKGMLIAKGWSKGEFLSHVEVSSREPDYYNSRLIAGSGTENKFDLQLVLRKKGKPIAMFARQISMELPELRKEIGFDFEKADWVKPYGIGRKTDCTFIGDKVYEDRDNYETTVLMSYPGPKAGMVLDSATQNKKLKMSVFHGSRQSPDSDYKHTHKFIHKKANKSRKGSTQEASYIFRSRVLLDASGKIKSCHYGKLAGAIDVAKGSGVPSVKPKVSFTYYFNPTPNDRNLEFDPDKNLFGELEWDEVVRAP